MKKKLCIVGGGVSGLYLASLLENKYEVTLLEARERLGGRVFSIDGHDMGPSWVWAHHKNMLKLIKDLELELFPQYTRGYALYDTKDKLELFTPQASQPSARLQGTLTLLIERLTQRLKSTKIILQQKVTDIENLKDSLKIRTDTDTFFADKAILTLAPRLSAQITYRPPPTKQQELLLKQTQTWMGNSAKCVIEFKTAFWREKGLSGFVFSNQGPLSEIHDACTDTKAALFGFVSSQANMQTFQKELIAQCKKIFGINKKEILTIHLVDWRREVYSSSPQDSQGLRSHPQYGIELSLYDERVLFSATEFSFQEGGYLEGALIRAEEIVKRL